ncbi:MAG: MFS transporter [Desulfopila sp.]|jgi:MFS family permease|nr:MFS transporter [Desulfopila sp.]
MMNNTLVTLLLSVFIAFMGIGIIVPIMPVFAGELGAGGLALGMIIAVFSITRGVLLPVVGNLSDKWGRKSFLAAGLFIYGLVGLLIPEAESVNQLITIRAFHGVGSAMIVPIAMAYLSLLAPTGQEGRYMSYLNIAIFSGIGCGPVIGGLIFDIMGFAAVFHLMALLSFFALFLVISFMPRHVPGKSIRPLGILPSLRNMAASLKTSGILLARCGTMIIMVPTMAFLPLIMSEWEGSSGLLIGIVIAARTLVNALLQVPFGKLSDRYNKLTIMSGSTSCLVLAVMCIPWMENFAQMLILYLFLGAAEAAVWAVLGAYASIEAKKHYGHGTMMGVFAMAMSLGVFFGAVISGITMDKLGIIVAFTITGCTVLVISLTAAAMIFLHNVRRSEL